MPDLADRRRIDWSVILPDDPPVAKLAGPAAPSSRLATLTSEAIAAPSWETADRLLRHAVDFSKAVVQLERSAIFLLDADHRAMVGTWGSDIRGETIDEHEITYEFGPIDREVFARARGGFPWTVYEDCPHIAQQDHTTRLMGRGWVACTPIRGLRGPIGILFNDTALSHATLDDAKQARTAMLCALLGQALDACRPYLLVGADTPRSATPHPVVRSATTLLVGDPTLSCNALAKRLDISAGRLARIFRREVGTSVVDHRNELRLARFLDRVDARAHNLLEAALDAGFGSYAQFHRVFRARFGKGPRQYLLEREAPARELPAEGADRCHPPPHE
jgi:AraC-like DNA-binding protein